MTRNKILFVAPRFHTNQFFLTKNLIEKNYEVNFLSIYIGGSENHDYIKPIISKSSRLLRLFLRKQNVESPIAREKLRKYHFTSFSHTFDLYKKYRPDILIIRNLKSLFSIQHFILGLMFVKTVVLYTQNNFRAHISFQRRLFYKFLGFLNIRHITPVYGDAEAPEIPNSIYLPFVIEKKVSEEEVRRRDDKPGIRIVTIGKLVPRKNILGLVKVIKRINEFHSTDNELIIIAESRTQEHLEYYKLLKKEVPEDSFKVMFELNTSHQQVLEILKNSDLFILPSINEPAAFSILEAMACGLGVICTNSNGTKCYIQEGVNGHVFEFSKDLRELKKILHRILDQKILTSYGLMSLKLVEQNHNVQKFIDNVIDPS